MQKAAIIGGGVIGAGWAARFLLHGWQVHFYDPSPAALEVVNRGGQNGGALGALKFMTICPLVAN